MPVGQDHEAGGIGYGGRAGSAGGHSRSRCPDAHFRAVLNTRIME